MLRYIREAIEIEKKGLKIKPEKHRSIPVSELLNKELEKNADLKKSFENLTSGRQKEYALYINDARRETTRLSRIEKIKPLILKGFGLNEKYKR